MKTIRNGRCQTPENERWRRFPNPEYKCKRDSGGEDSLELPDYEILIR
jgi:hypothetical protein